MKQLENIGDAFRLLDLPAEVIDNILGHVPLHRDLLNFALASRFCSTMVIPRHTEYRVIDFEENEKDQLWTHLVQRPDLACNIREIHILYGDDAPTESFWGPTYHYPKDFLEMSPEPAPKTRQAIRDDMFEALRHMARLERVHWNWLPKRSKDLVLKVFDVLKTLPMLKHLSFYHPKTFSMDVPLAKHPLWTMTTLESLNLEGPAWPNLSWLELDHALMMAWFQSLSLLQFLRMDVGVFLSYSDELSFPDLRCLSLQGNSLQDIPLVKFLQRHSGLEEVSLPLRRLFQVPADLLPNLKRLACLPHVLLDLEAGHSRNRSPTDPPSWHLEHLHITAGQWGFGEHDARPFVDTFCDLTCIDRTALRALHLGVSGSVSALNKLANLYPGIEELYISPGLYRKDERRTQPIGFADTLLIFPHFLNLRVIHGNSIWTRLPEDILDVISIMPPDDRLIMFLPSPMDPKTNFALNACNHMQLIQIGNLCNEDGEWTDTAEVNHRIVSLARRCKKLERMDSHINEEEIIRIERKKVNRGNGKAMADWLGRGKVKAEILGWEEIQYSIEERCSRNPFETMPTRYADGI
ncbi:hypothetical protein BDN72DRAFT_844371 [Pluteus cervinus]|uniref:Uncharacterized protein n=1 Tax=Pluteus cervinus TaxID=181527 RepID=A0ACD3AMH0_9AGAR|nr:hypothetical protein BDN72DRAFT_844371 [Pluteus cervinus]